ncbi:MAG: hypothetical protein EBT43_06715, partial [Methylocystaceae bacterium]|nr:hypothetical protein [Methylocystaceae bacterium]
QTKALKNKIASRRKNKASPKKARMDISARIALSQCARIKEFILRNNVSDDPSSQSPIMLLGGCLSQIMERMRILS